MSLTHRVLIGLAAGLLVGAAISATGNPFLRKFVSLVEPFGNLWINAILMTIIPLVVSSLIVAVVSASNTQAIGKMAARAIALFLALLVSGAIMTALIMPSLVAWLPIDPKTSELLKANAGRAGNKDRPFPTTGEWLVGLMPANPIKAAADGAMLPLIIFSLAFALAATRISDKLRQQLVSFFQAIAETVHVLLGWIILLSPFGIFALALVLAGRVGLAAAGALGSYMVLSSSVLLVFTLALYVVATVGGRVSIRSFAEASAPAQIVAFSSHSSLASLPAMIQGAQGRLGLSTAITGFVLPLAVSTFKFSSPIWYMVVVYFIGRLYGIAISPIQMAPVVMVAVLTSFGVAGVPGGAVYVVAPVLIAAGLPTEAIGFLIAADPIPNAFRTVANVTADLTAAAVLSRSASQNSSPQRELTL